MLESWTRCYSGACSQMGNGVVVFSFGLPPTFIGFIKTIMASLQYPLIPFPLEQQFLLDFLTHVIECMVCCKPANLSVRSTQQKTKKLWNVSLLPNCNIWPRITFGPRCPTWYCKPFNTLSSARCVCSLRIFFPYGFICLIRAVSGPGNICAFFSPASPNRTNRRNCPVLKTFCRSFPGTYRSCIATIAAPPSPFPVYHCSRNPVMPAFWPTRATKYHCIMCHLTFYYWLIMKGNLASNSNNIIPKLYTSVSKSVSLELCSGAIIIARIADTGVSPCPQPTTG